MKIFLIEIFKLFLKIVYFFLKFLPTTNKITFISRQTNYIHIDFKLISEEIKKRNSNIKLVFLCQRLNKGLLNYLKYLWMIFRQMYHIATSKVVVLDSYCIPISVLQHKKSLIVVQIWHSIGKIKKSGYQTLGTESGRSSEIAKHMCMHKNYTVIIVGGKAFDKFYEQGFNVKKDVLLHYGLPRIDNLLDNYNLSREKFFNKFPELVGKKIVYYAPTFRNYHVDGYKQLFDKYNPNDFALITSFHPNQKLEITNNNIYVMNLKEFNANELISVCDYIITDYSSIALEAAVLNKKTLYFLYDYNEYMQKNGLNLDPKISMPTCSFQRIEPILDIIVHDKYDDDALKNYRKKYLPPKLGHSTELIVDYIMKSLKE